VSRVAPATFPGGLWLLIHRPALLAGMGGHTTPRKEHTVTDPKDAKNGVKTLGIKLPPELHAQFALVAQLDEINLTVAILRAVELYVATKRAEPDFAERAAAALAEIQREADSRRAAIEGLFGASPEAAAGDEAASTEKATSPTKPATSRSRKAGTEG
jgi:hypothetical protein